MKIDIRAIPKRDRAQFAAVGVSLLGIVVLVSGGLLVPILTRLPPAAVTIDGVRGVDGDALWKITDLSRDVCSIGFTMMAAGAIVWSVISPGKTPMFIWSRVSAFLLWSSLLVLMFAFPKMTLAEIGGTLAGKLAYGALGVALVSVFFSLVTESVLSFRAMKSSPKA